MHRVPKTGVGGTVDAFNFIRRIAFPSTRVIVAIFAGIGITSSLVSLVISGETLPQSLVFAGAVFVWPGLAGEFLNSVVLLRGDRILDFRRLMGIEVVSALMMSTSLLILSIIGAIAKNTPVWQDGFLIGLAVSSPVRFLTPMSMSSFNAWRKVLSALPTLLITTLSFAILSPFLSKEGPTNVQTGLLLGSMVVVSAVGSSLIIKRVEAQGKTEISYSPMELFRSFLEHWLSKTPAALEERLLSLSTEGSIETKILGFVGSDSQPVASIVVSNFHPGPYRDLGSGGLPSEMKRYLEESNFGIVHVPHGISNHKLNIVSHRDIEKLLTLAKESYPAEHSIREASATIREQEGEAIVSGQAFGNIALLTVTLAPEEMEDLPTEVSIEIERAASRLGFQPMVIDAHNSIMGQTSITTAQADRIIKAAVRVLNRLSAIQKGPFSIGAAYDSLAAYGLKDGIAPGGLSVIVVRTTASTFAYLTIDGNNMQQGFRDRIISSIKNSGINDGEVMTTDTHLVTGLVRSPLGYYPVGAALPADSFLSQIKNTVRSAVENLEAASAGASKFSVQIQVLGSDTFNSITSFIGRVARQIGRQFYWLEAISLAIALVVLFVV